MDKATAATKIQNCVLIWILSKICKCECGSTNLKLSILPRIKCIECYHFKKEFDGCDACDNDSDHEFGTPPPPWLLRLHMLVKLEKRDATSKTG